jgi:hypothetical protein
MRNLVLLTGALLLAPALSAQSTTGAPQTRVPTAADSAILRALEFPRIMQRARAAGAADSTLRGMLEIMRTRGLPAHDATAALETEVEILEQGGNKDNFGQFVKSQVESGLRGRELAASIRAERARRGMGPDRAQRAAGQRGGRPDGAGARPEGRGGRPDGAGARPDGSEDRPSVRGRPDAANAPPVTGRPAGSSRPNADSTRGKPAPGSVRRP